MDPGRLAPCVAHDINGGFGKDDLGFVLKKLSHDRLLSTCDFIQDKLLGLRQILRYKDKSDLSTRLPG